MFNAYSIFWVVLKPVKGLVTLTDVKKGNKKGFVKIGQYIVRHSPDKDKLISLAKGLSLSKKYVVTIITDKQFGMLKGYDFSLLFTKLQIQNQFEI